MEQKRFLVFMTVSAIVLVLWSKFVVPKFLPEPQPAQKQQAVELDDQPADQQQADQADKAKETAVADTSDVSAAKTTDADEAAEKTVKADAEEKPAADGEKKPPELVRYPQQTVLLGSTDPETGYFLEVELVSQGGAVNRVSLSDPRYRKLDFPDEALGVVNPVVIANLDNRLQRTLGTQIKPFDEQLAAYHLDTDSVNWELLPQENAAAGPRKEATFRLVSPDGQYEARKHYSIQPVDLPADENHRAIRDTDHKGYELAFSLTIINKGDRPGEVQYTLQGPVGLPLENVENTRAFRNLRMGFLGDDGLNAESLSARELVKETDAEEEKGEKVEQWDRPFAYMGVDVQYFAALLLPAGDQMADPYFAKSIPMLIHKQSQADRSDISVKMTSKEVALQPGGEVKHDFTLYVGPKRRELLDPYQATQIIDYGMFGFVSKAMVALLLFLHNTLAVPYGIAIIILTVVVRGSLFPLSMKQAAGAKKMKELQPKIAELKKKYANDKEGLGRAQMELFSKHNYNPLAGCLPVFFQLPIFIGLYQALNNAVDLRMASFLWVNNLAAPDALFPLPFTVPFFGWTDFNLLPILTIILFIVQQKILMPPATDPEQAMQQKMMKYMMVFMGVLFYRVPAGLCVYFISSSLWGLAERKLLDLRKTPDPSPASPKKEKKRSALAGFWEQMAAAADAAAQQQAKGDGTGKKTNSKKK